MKLNERSLLFISIGLLLVAALILNATGVITRVGNKLLDISRRQSNDLNVKLIATQERVRAIQLEPLTARKASLEQQLSQTAKQLDTVQAKLSQPVNTTNITTIVFDTTKTYSLDITQWKLSAPGYVTLAGMNASAVLLTATVEGDMGNLTGFITRLNNIFTNGAMESVIITNPEIAGKKPSADIKLTLFTVPGR